MSVLDEIFAQFYELKDDDEAFCLWLANNEDELKKQFKAEHRQTWQAGKDGRYDSFREYFEHHI